MNKSTNENSNMSTVSTRLVEILYPISKMLLYVSFCGLGVLFYLFGGTADLCSIAVVLMSPFIFYTTANLWKLFVNSKFKKKEIDCCFNCAAFLIPATAVLVCVLPCIINPALLGMTGLHVVFRICAIVESVAVLGKFIIASISLLKKDPTVLDLFANIFNTLLYGVGMALGVATLILNGSFTVIPIVFTAIFTLRTVASICDVFSGGNSVQNIGKVARLLKTISFLVGVLAFGAAVFSFAPAVAFSLVVPVSFVKVVGSIGMGVCALAMFTEMFIGNVSQYEPDLNFVFNFSSGNKSSLLGRKKESIGLSGKNETKKFDEL